MPSAAFQWIRTVFIPVISAISKQQIQINILESVGKVTLFRSYAIFILVENLFFFHFSYSLVYRSNEKTKNEKIKDDKYSQ